MVVVQVVRLNQAMLVTMPQCLQNATTFAQQLELLPAQHAQLGIIGQLLFVKHVKIYSLTVMLVQRLEHALAVQDQLSYNMMDYLVSLQALLVQQ